MSPKATIEVSFTKIGRWQELVESFRDVLQKLNGTIRFDEIRELSSKLSHIERDLAVEFVELLEQIVLTSGDGLLEQVIPECGLIEQRNRVVSELVAKLLDLLVMVAE